jgi:hypothetical protein
VHSWETFITGSLLSYWDMAASGIRSPHEGVKTGRLCALFERVKKTKGFPLLKTRLIPVIAGLVMMISVPGAVAQQPPYGPWVLTIQGGLASQSESDLEDSSGAFSLNRWFVSAGVDYLWDSRNSLGISFGAGSSDYEFKDFAGFGGTGPWSKVEDQRLSLTGRFSFSETGTAIIIPSYRYNGETDSDTGEARTWGVLAGAAWKVSDNLNIGPGIGVFSRLEDSTRVFPILVIDWDISERWNLSTGQGLAASQGPGLTLRYEASPTWSLGLTGRFEDVEFRLDEDGPAPGGIGRDQAFPLVVSARWKPNLSVALSVFAGGEFAGELELMDAAGNTLEESSYDAAVLLGGTFEFRF